MRIFLLMVLAYLLTACNTLHPQTKASAIYTDWHVEQRWMKEKNAHPRYTVEAHFPEITSPSYSTSALPVNHIIQQFVAQQVQAFKDKISVYYTDLIDFPIEMRTNYLHITSTTHLLTLDHRTVVSTRFYIEQLFAGKTHPTRHYRVLNYDLTTGEKLSLASLFKPGVDYLDILSSYCREHLTEKLTEDMAWLPWDDESISAKAENYKLWNLQKDGIEITFLESQVAPYSPEALVVLVPYKVVSPAHFIIGVWTNHGKIVNEPAREPEPIFLPN